MRFKIPAFHSIVNVCGFGKSFFRYSLSRSTPSSCLSSHAKMWGAQKSTIKITRFVCTEKLFVKWTLIAHQKFENLATTQESNATTTRGERAAAAMSVADFPLTRTNKIWLLAWTVMCIVCLKIIFSPQTSLHLRWPYSEYHTKGLTVGGVGWTHYSGKLWLLLAAIPGGSSLYS